MESSHGFRRREPEVLIQRVLLLHFACILCVLKSTFCQEIPCSENPDEPLPFLKAVLLSKMILYGKILNNYPDSRFNDGRYIAEMEVYCVIKGSRTRRVINITDAGLVPGICFSTELNTGSNYVLLAQFDGGKYRPVDTEKPGTESILEEVASACYNDPKYPIGVHEHSGEFSCPNAAPPGECIDMNHFTTTTTTTEATTDDDYEEFYTGDPIRDDENPGGYGLPSQASSHSPPALITSVLSTSSTDYHLIPSVRLLPVLVLGFLYKVLGTCLKY